MKNEEKENGGGRQTTATRIESLDQLRALTVVPVLARVLIDGALLEIPVSRMSQATNERVRALYRKARPPWNPAMNKGNGGYDDLNAKYLDEQALNEAIARSVTIYCHCPLVVGQKPGLLEDAAIHACVSALSPDPFPEPVLSALALTIRASGTQIDLADLQARVNFT